MCINTTAAISARVNYQLPDGARYLAASTAIASGLCSLTIIVLHLLIRCLPSRSGSEAHSRLFVVFLSVCDLVVCALNALGAFVFDGTESDRYVVLCQVQAVVSVYFNLAFLLWVSSFVFFLYISIVRDNIKGALRYIFVFHLLSWGLPVAVALLTWFLGAAPEQGQISQVPGGINHFSRATVGWCWIGEYPKYPTNLTCENARLFWMLLSGRGWEVASYLLLPILVVLIHNYVTEVTSPLSYRYSHPTTVVVKASMKSISRRVYFLVGTFILLRIWGTTRVFFDYGEFFQDNSQLNNVFTYFQAFGDNAQGIVNIVLFIFLSPKTLSDMKVMFRCRCPRCCCYCCERYERRQAEREEEEERRRYQDGHARYRDLAAAVSAPGDEADDDSRRYAGHVLATDPSQGPESSLTTTGSPPPSSSVPVVRPRPGGGGRVLSGSSHSSLRSRNSLELTLNSQASFRPDSLNVADAADSAGSLLPSDASSASRSSRSYLKMASPIDEMVEPPTLGSPGARPLSYPADDRPPAPLPRRTAGPPKEVESPPPRRSSLRPEKRSFMAAPSHAKTPLLSDTDDLNL